MTIDTDTTPETMHPAQRRQLQWRLDEARREWVDARAEDARLRDELELAMQAEGEASAAHRRAQGDAFAVRWDAGAGSAERARVDRTEAVLHAATQQRVQAEQRLHPSPLSDDVRLGRVVPVGYRLAAAGQRVRALAAALGEPLEPGEEEPPGPALPGGPPLYTLGPTGTEILARAAAAGEADDAPEPALDGSPLRARIRAGLERLG